MPNDRLLRMEQISKSYPGVAALQSVDFDLVAGEVHALVGENGAGKSTLVKILAGVVRHDGGTIWLQGRKMTGRSPRAMMDAGVRVIHQELNLVPGLSVAENLFLGRLPSRGAACGVVDWRSLYRQTDEVLGRFRLQVDPRTAVDRLGAAQQQIIEVAKAISCAAKIIAMDEPTASLTERETATLFEMIRDLQRQQVAVIYISHRLDEIRRIADRVTVLRDGRRVVTADQKDLSEGQMIRHMVGREIEAHDQRSRAPAGEILLSVEGLSRRGVCDNVSFQLRHGEILGVAGLVGSGRTETIELLFGRRQADRGTVRVAGKPIALRSPRQALRHGIGLIPEDRKSDGLVMGMSILDNMTMSILKRHSIGGFVRRRSLTRLAAAVTQQIRLKTASLDSQVKTLSGGNQQKVVLARWLLHGCQIYLFDEPTRGVDVGAKREIYRLMENLVKEGAGIIMISSDLPEVLRMSDRILVMRGGRRAGELSCAEATQESVLQLMVGSEGVAS